VEVDTEDDLGGDDGGDGHVDGEAERRPPAGPSYELVAVLPEVLGAVGEVEGDQEPGVTDMATVATTKNATTIMLSPAITLVRLSDTANPM